MFIALVVTLWLSSTSASAPPQTVSPPRPDAQGDQPPAGYYFILGRYLEGEGKIPEAIDALKRAIELEPQSAEPTAELAALYARQDRAQEAVTSAEAALKIDPKNREANRILGSVLAALTEQPEPGRSAAQIAQDQTRAITALETARANTTADLSLDLALARLYMARDRSADAVPLLRHLVDEQPSYGDGWLLLSSALETSGNADEAADVLEQGINELPNLFRARVQLAELYERQHRWPQAAEAWAQVQTLNQRNTEIAGRHASALLNASRPADARSVLTDALKVKPGDARLLYLLAQAQRESGDLDAAEATARELRTAHSDDIRGVYVLAQILESRGRHQEVVDLLKPEIARLREAEGQGPQVALLLDSQGLSLQQMQRHDEAVAAFREAVERAPNEPIRHSLLIQGLSQANRSTEAFAAAEAARRKFPDDTGILYQLGAAFDRSGKSDEAERTFRDLIQRDPLDANALNYLGYMFAEHGTKLDEAVSLIERALKVEPDNPSFLDSLGWAYVQQGKLESADEPLTKAAQKLPRNSVVQEHLGDLRLKQNRRADAIAAWQRALTGDGDSIDRAKIQKKITDARKER
jgi:tetratricopeptide (TPR) repeat protein